MQLIRRPRSPRPFVAAAALLVGAACGGAEDTAGPCYVGYEEPLFTVASAVDARTGAPLRQVVLRSYSFDGDPTLGPDYLTEFLGLTPRNVTASGGTLLCDIACAFGAAEGRYALTFGAPGYRDTTLTLDARYARFTGGCPAMRSGGVVLRLELSER